MPTESSSATITLTSTQIRGVTVGAGVVMTVLGVGGLAVSVILDGDMALARLAYIAAFAALLVSGQATMVIATVRGNAAIIRHQRGIERAAVRHFADLTEHQKRMEKAADDHFRRITELIDERIDNGVQERLDQVEHLVMTVHELQKRVAAVIGDVIEKQIEVRDDELGKRRKHGSSG